VGVQNTRRDRQGIITAEVYIGKKDRRVVMSKVSYVVLRGGWCILIVLNVHAPNKEKCNVSKDSFMRNYNISFIIFLSTISGIILGHFNAKVG